MHEHLGFFGRGCFLRCLRHTVLEVDHLAGECAFRHPCYAIRAPILSGKLRYAVRGGLRNRALFKDHLFGSHQKIRPHLSSIHVVLGASQVADQAVGHTVPAAAIAEYRYPGKAVVVVGSGVIAEVNGVAPYPVTHGHFLGVLQVGITVFYEVLVDFIVFPVDRSVCGAVHFALYVQDFYLVGCPVLHMDDLDAVPESLNAHPERHAVIVGHPVGGVVENIGVFRIVRIPADGVERGVFEFLLALLENGRGYIDIHPPLHEIIAPVE